MSAKARPAKAKSANSNEKTRVTYIIPGALDRNLEVYAALEGRQKTEIVTEALSRFLKDKGFQPDKYPKIRY